MFPSIEPYEHGMLDAGDSQHIYWECSGNPCGRPIIFVHGGPGSGSRPNSRRLFDPSIYNIIIADQRGCGRSIPRVETLDDLKVNTTQHLIADIERLREHLRIHQWSVLGASWGTTLALAYAQQFPMRVTSMILASVTTTSRREVEWMTHDMGRMFPEQRERFASVRLPTEPRRINLASTYAQLLFDKAPAVREKAAREWCAWEDTHISLAPGYVPNPRYNDPEYRLLFARLVTHYWKNAAFLEEDQLIRNAPLLNDIPGVLIHGRHDVSTPLETAWRLHNNWRGSTLEIIDDAGHGGQSMLDAILRATNRV
jgi:proline iminopeptidase